MIVRRGQMVGLSVAAIARPRVLQRQITTTIARVILAVGAPTSRHSAMTTATARITPTAGVLMRRHSGITAARPTGIVAMPSSPLTRRRAVTLRRGRILRPAAATQRRLVPTLHRAAATAEEEVTAEEAVIGVEVATVAAVGRVAAASVAHTAVAVAHIVAVEVALTKKSLNL